MNADDFLKKIQEVGWENFTPEVRGVSKYDLLGDFWVSHLKDDLSHDQRLMPYDKLFDQIMHWIESLDSSRFFVSQLILFISRSPYDYLSFYQSFSKISDKMMANLKFVSQQKPEYSVLLTRWGLQCILIRMLWLSFLDQMNSDQLMQELDDLLTRARDVYNHLLCG